MNLLELMAVGIHNNIFDEKVCYDYWGDTLTQTVVKADPVIAHVRKQPFGMFTYQDVMKLDLKWREKIAEAARSSKRAENIAN